MRNFSKFIVTFFLLMLSFSISGNAGNSSCISVCSSSCQFSESTSESNQRSSVDSHSVSYDNSQSLSISDVELEAKPLTESIVNNYRLRRIIEINEPTARARMYQYHVPDIVANTKIPP